MMREHPWSVRNATSEDERWFQNLLDLHAFTGSWIQEIQMERPVHLLKLAARQHILESQAIMDILHSVTTSDLRALFDHSYPAEWLGRLERAIWSVHAWTLTSILERAQGQDLEVIRYQLDQSSWKAGREYAKKHWAGLPDRARHDLRGILAALKNTPIFEKEIGGAGFLVVRSVPMELRLELQACPHQCSFSEVAAVADDLCRLHNQWIRGFTYEINTAVGIECEPASRTGHGRCRQRWYFEGSA